MKKKYLAAVAVAASALFGASAHAGIVTIDNFNNGDQFINQNGTDTNMYRTLSTTLVSSVPPVQSTAEVSFGTLTVTNGSGESSRVSATWNVQSGTVANGASDLSFLFKIVESDANATNAEFFLDGVSLGKFNIPGNTNDTDFGISIDNLLWDDSKDHALQLVLTGATGWDLQLDALGLQFTDPSPTGNTVPEPGSLALLSLGLLGAGVARRRANRKK